MTEERKIGGNRWTDFVKEYAKAHNVSYMCASTNPEVKAEWKNKKSAEKTPKSAKKAKAPTLSHEQVVEKALAKAKETVPKETVPKEPKVKGRPKKYATPEEAHRAKLEKTKISVQKKRASQPKKERVRAPGKLAKAVADLEIKAVYGAKTKEQIDEVESLLRNYLKDHPIPSLTPVTQKTVYSIDRVLTDKRRSLGLIRQGMGQSDIPNSVCSVPIPSEPVSLTIQDFKPKKRGRPKKAKKEAPAFHSFEGQGYDNGEMGPMGEARPKRTGGMDLSPSISPSTFAPSVMDVGEWYENPLTVMFAGVAGVLGLCCSIYAITALSRAITQQFRYYRGNRRVAVIDEEGGEPEMVEVGRQVRVPQAVVVDDPLADWGRQNNVPTAVVDLVRDNIETAIEIRPLDEVEALALDATEALRENPSVFGILARNFEPIPSAEASEITNEADVRALRRNPYGRIIDPHQEDVEEPIPTELQNPLISQGSNVGRGFNLRRVFHNYGKIKDHLGKHLSDLKEPVDPKDVRDYVYFTKEQARLKDKLVGKGFFDNIGNAFKSTFNAPPKSSAERGALNFFYNDFLPTASLPVKAIAPPLGMLSDKVFSGLKEQQLGQGRRRKG